MNLTKKERELQPKMSRYVGLNKYVPSHLASWHVNSSDILVSSIISFILLSTIDMKFGFVCTTCEVINYIFFVLFCYDIN